MTCLPATLPAELLSIFLSFTSEAAWPEHNFGFLRTVCLPGTSLRVWVCLAGRGVAMVGFAGVTGGTREGLGAERALEWAWEGLGDGLVEGLGAVWPGLGAV